MSSLPYYPRYPRDFLDGTVGLTFEEKGAYSILLDLIYYMGDKGLVDDSRYIAGQLNCSVRKWNSIRQSLIEKSKIQVENGIISNFRADKEKIKQRKFQDKQAENRRRPNKNNDLEKPASDHTDTDTYIDDDDSAGARDLTEREQLLLAMGHDQSGVTANGRIVGNRSDMAEAGRWSDDLGLTHSEQIEVIKDVCARKRDGPPNSFTYFTEAMRRAAGEKSRARLTPSEPKYSNVIPASIPRVRAQLPE